MANDREATLKKAETFLRAGRLDAAIAEYARVVDAAPEDWTTAKTLGDLYVKAGQSKKAVALYARIAEHLNAEGFYPKAAALLKKILKIVPGDEESQLRLAETSVRQGLLAEARTHFTAVEKRRRKRGDAPGADDIIARIGALDAGDAGAAPPATQGAQSGSAAGAPASRYADLFEECIEGGRYDDARRLLVEATSSGAASPDSVLALGWTYCDTNPDAAAICVDVVTDAFVATGAFAEAAAALQACAARMPNRVPTLLRLVEVCLDGGLEETMLVAQTQLADAYLAAGRVAEARVIAEDLVNRDPSSPEHLARLRLATADLHATDAESVLTLDPTIDEVESLQALLEVELPEPPPPQTRRGPAPAAPDHAGFPVDVPTAGSAAVEIDLTSMLGELKAPAAAANPPARPRDLEEVFAEIRAEVSEEAADSSADHLVLARSYLEMGMLGEAASCLETAARAPQLRFTAATMLAEIRREEGNLPEAIEWFERAAEAPPPGPEEGRALLYDLGDVLETVGETARALAVFLELHADSPEYRDVGERVTRLSRVETEG